MWNTLSWKQHQVFKSSQHPYTTCSTWKHFYSQAGTALRIDAGNISQSTDVITNENTCSNATCVRWARSCGRYAIIFSPLSRDAPRKNLAENWRKRAFPTGKTYAPASWSCSRMKPMTDTFRRASLCIRGLLFPHFHLGARMLFRSLSVSILRCRRCHFSPAQSDYDWGDWGERHFSSSLRLLSWPFSPCRKMYAPKEGEQGKPPVRRHLPRRHRDRGQRLRWRPRDEREALVHIQPQHVNVWDGGNKLKGVF